jgi:ATP-dependent Clp protease ATP-binding subunit ClpX
LEGTVANVPPQGGRKHPQQETIPINTTNILFICGGAFDGLDKIIESRTDKSAIGFDAPVESKKKRDVGKLLAKVQPHDLLKFGIIPELVGRMPVITALQDLKKEDLIRILVEPKNALVKQYIALLEMDNVKLEIQDEALEAIAQKAIDRQIGARGLRAVMEETMLKVMYTIPSDLSIRKVIITAECVNGGEPKIVRNKAKPRVAIDVQ